VEVLPPVSHWGGGGSRTGDGPGFFFTDSVPLLLQVKEEELVL
jgi:hypothetical protein